MSDGAILLAGRSVRWQELYTLPVFKSTDKGKIWKLFSIIDANKGKPGQLSKPDKGVYEPHFYFLNDGRLSVMYANEKHVTETPSYSLIISQKISNNMGETWDKEIWVAYQPGHNASRPGMSVWTKMDSGKYIVVYEIFGPENCNVYYKISNDGISWPFGLGKKIPDQLGGPYILSLNNGNLLVTSNKSNISVSNDFGQTWKTINAAWPKTLWPSVYQIGDNEIGEPTL
ncbi:MAG: sialidase family protein [Sphingobacteriaceae bacterium]